VTASPPAGRKETAMTANSFEAQLESEIRRRVDAIEDPSYDFGPRFSRTSWIWSTVVIVLCLLAIFLV
jgi:hypothetical protein